MSSNPSLASKVVCEASLLHVVLHGILRSEPLEILGKLRATKQWLHNDAPTEKPRKKGRMPACSNSRGLLDESERNQRPPKKRSKILGTAYAYGLRFNLLESWSLFGSATI